MKHWGPIDLFCDINHLAKQGDTCFVEGIKYQLQEDRWQKVSIKKVDTKANTAENNGGTTSYYDVPEGAKTLNDLIEYKEMPFYLGEIFKATYALPERATRSDNASEERELNKIIYYAQRRLNRIKHESNKQ